MKTTTASTATPDDADRASASPEASAAAAAQRPSRAPSRIRSSSPWLDLAFPNLQSKRPVGTVGSPTPRSRTTTRVGDRRPCRHPREQQVSQDLRGVPPGPALRRDASPPPPPKHPQSMEKPRIQTLAMPTMKATISSPEPMPPNGVNRPTSSTARRISSAGSAHPKKPVHRTGKRYAATATLAPSGSEDLASPCSPDARQNQAEHQPMTSLVRSLILAATPGGRRGGPPSPVRPGSRPLLRLRRRVGRDEPNERRTDNDTVGIYRPRGLFRRAPTPRPTHTGWFVTSSTTANGHPPRPTYGSQTPIVDAGATNRC